MSSVYDKPVHKEQPQQREPTGRKHSNGTGKRWGQKVHRLHPRQDPLQWSLRKSGINYSYIITQYTQVLTLWGLSLNTLIKRKNAVNEEFSGLMSLLYFLVQSVLGLTICLGKCSSVRRWCSTNYIYEFEKLENYVMRLLLFYVDSGLFFASHQPLEKTFC